MFHIFIKKRFLVDALKGFVDIHNHLLPGIDDGAKDVEDSIAMIKEFESFGVTKFITTPHIMNDYYPNTPETIGKALNLLRSELLNQDLEHIAIEAAAEHMIDGTFENLLSENKVMPLQAEYLLVEMSYVQPAINFKSAIVKSARAGYFSILAHPERYIYFHDAPQVYNQFKEIGVLFQLNLLSMGNYYGARVTNMAHDLLEAGNYDFLATDVHSLKHLKALREIQLPLKIIQKLNPIINKTIETFY